MAAGIKIVGLGPAGPELMTLQAQEILAGAQRVFLRTSSHPATASFEFQGKVESFDDLYLEAESFEVVYQRIAGRIIEEALTGQPVVYAVPGDPTVGEATTELIRQGAAEHELPFQIIHGVSFIEPCLAALKLDALDGLMIEDALTLIERSHPTFPPDQPVLISQIHSKMVASDLKLTLLNQYPEGHPVVLLDGAGGERLISEHVPLYQIDREFEFSSRTCLYLNSMEQGSSFEGFQELVAHLRSPEGCPWDREQTHLSLRKHMLEEAFETLEALDSEEPARLREELGDLMLQLVLQTQIASEQGEFLMADVLADIHSKLVRRHPHVFGDVLVEDVPEVLTNWEGLKAAERKQDGGERSALSGVPRTLPALAQSDEYQARAARLGFDWPEQSGVLAKIEEEIAEVAEAQDEAQQAAEIGDLLFSVVNYARWLGIDPESSLREANGRFRRRFQRVEELVDSSGKAMKDFSIDQLEDFWLQAKEELAS